MILHYLKFFLFHIVGLVALLTLLAGGYWITIGFLGTMAFYVIGDAIAGDDLSTPEYKHTWLLTAQLWLALPLLSSIVFVSVWSISNNDAFGFGHWLTQLSGYDVLAARAQTSFGHHLSGFCLTFLMVGLIGTITAHELTHRTWDKISMFIGRWLLAFSFDTSFAIEHVYGHHRYVSTKQDPATAPRGRNVYAHMLISTVKGNISAWHIEQRRLARNGKNVWSLQNAFLRGHLMSVVLVVLAWLIGGWQAVLYFSAVAICGKFLLEIVNYMEHYGIVRNPNAPVQSRHSWNTNRRISSWSMFNLTRHSHHHAQGEVAYQNLKPFPESPMMIGGYLSTILVALIPPLWHHLMTPKVLHWDKYFACDDEQELIREANINSNNKEFLSQL